MKGTIKIENVDEIEATLTMTMSIRDWKSLKSQLETHYPSWKLSKLIGMLVTRASRTYEQEENLDE